MSGWIGIDFDGTLAFYEGWTGMLELGKPIPGMVAFVEQLLQDGQDVRIFTARGGESPETWAQSVKAIGDWCEQYVGRRLPVTNVKDCHMIALYDDRAFHVPRNSGKPQTDKKVEALVNAARNLVKAMESEYATETDVAVRAAYLKQVLTEW